MSEDMISQTSAAAVQTMIFRFSMQEVFLSGCDLMKGHFSSGIAQHWVFVCDA
jgi:hypothetical protein